MDMDLLEVLWKQDVDLGFTLNDAKLKVQEQNEEKEHYEAFVKTHCAFKILPDDDDELKIEPKEEKKDIEDEEDLWAGITYTIDTETGEYVAKTEDDTHGKSEELEMFSPIPEHLLDAALTFVDRYEHQIPQHEYNNSTPKPVPPDNTEFENLFSKIMQPSSETFHQIQPQMQPPAPPGYPQPMQPPQIPQPNSVNMGTMHTYSPHAQNYPPQQQSYSQQISVVPVVPYASPVVPKHDQYVPDASRAATAMPRSVSSHVGEHGAPSPYDNHSAALITALTTSLDLSSHNEPISPSEPGSVTTHSNEMPLYQNHYPAEPTHQNNFTNLLTDEDLKLMEMAMNEGMYTMRSLETTDLSPLTAFSPSKPSNHQIKSFNKSDSGVESASDSADSIGSELYQNLSDGDWCDNESDLAHSPAGRNYYNEKSIESRLPHQIPQKKHQMFGKRQTGDQRDPTQFSPTTSESSDSQSSKSERKHLTRDEKRARDMNIQMSVDDIINLPMDEFNEQIAQQDCNENQLSLIRDIRRRGKNKVAAQNCRKRKLDQITNLADEVREMKDKKIKLYDDHRFVTSEVKRMKEKFQELYRYVFQNLRDPNGNQYSPYYYSLQTAADGSMVIVPKSAL